MSSKPYQKKSPGTKPAYVKKDNTLTSAKSVTYDIVGTVAYLAGVNSDIIHEREPKEFQAAFDRQMKPSRGAAVALRSAAMIRSELLKSGKPLQNRIRYDGATIQSASPEIFEAFSQVTETKTEIPEEFLSLSQFFVQKPREEINTYLIEVNKVIEALLPACKKLFPIWVKWEYVENMFTMPGGTQYNTITQAVEYYKKNRTQYQYDTYLNWKFRSGGEGFSFFSNDQRFLSMLYAVNNDTFTDNNKVSIYDDSAKQPIYDFISESNGCVVMVDCENCDPFRFVGAIRSLESQYIEKIKKIMLITDENATPAWENLKNFCDVPVETKCIKRIKENKSLVDMSLAIAACNERHVNQVDSFILASSDSDYWALISAMSDTKFLVLLEHDKCGGDIKEALAKSDIYYCYLDDFYSESVSAMIGETITTEVRKRFDALSPILNAEMLLNSILTNARITINDAEHAAYLDMLTKSIGIQITDGYNVNLTLTKDIAIEN